MLAWIKQKWASLQDAIRGYRTIAFNVIAAAAPLLLLMLDYMKTVDASAVLSPHGLIVYGMFINLANIGLRYVTTTKVGGAQPDDEVKAG